MAEQFHADPMAEQQPTILDILNAECGDLLKLVALQRIHPGSFGNFTAEEVTQDPAKALNTLLATFVPKKPTPEERLFAQPAKAEEHMITEDEQADILATPAPAESMEPVVPTLPPLRFKLPKKEKPKPLTDLPHGEPLAVRIIPHVSSVPNPDPRYAPGPVKHMIFSKATLDEINGVMPEWITFRKAAEMMGCTYQAAVYRGKSNRWQLKPREAGRPGVLFVSRVAVESWMEAHPNLCVQPATPPHAQAQ